MKPINVTKLLNVIVPILSVSIIVSVSFGLGYIEGIDRKTCPPCQHMHQVMQDQVDLILEDVAIRKLLTCIPCRIKFMHDNGITPEMLRTKPLSFSQRKEGF